MSKDKEEKQLLEDASTLLMFANAAARQRSPPSPSAQGNQQQRSPHAQSAAIPVQHPFPPEHKSSFDHNRPYDQPAPPAVYPPIQAQTNFGSHQDVTKTSQGVQQQRPHFSPHTALPHMVPTQAYYSYAFGAGAALPPKQPVQNSYSPPGEPDQQPRRASTAFPASLPLQSSTSAQSVLPAQGKFQTHVRTPSGGYYPHRSPPGHVTSPGPASMVLSRGINVESGKRNTNNAVIAAAALAAAADIPLPLKAAEKEKRENETKTIDSTREPKADISSDTKWEKSVQPKKEDTSEAVAGQVSGKPEASAATNQAPISTAQAQENLQREAVLTEPEDDAQTDEEPLIDEPIKPDTPQSMTEAEVADPGVDGNESKTEPETVIVKRESTPIPPLDSYKVDPDSGVIGCICGIEEDDGFTIQCDVCFRWQHCMCMGYQTNEEVPEDVYKCYYCDESKWNKFDPSTCRNDTLHRLDLERVNEPEAPPATKRKSSTSGSDDKKRRKSEKDAKYASEKQGGEKRKVSGSNASSSASTVQSATINICNKNNTQLEDGVSAEAYQGVYYKLTANDFKTPYVKETMARLGDVVGKGNFPGIETLPLSQFQSIELSKVILPNYQKHLQEKQDGRRNKHCNGTSIQVKTYSDNPKQKYVSVPKIGVFISGNQKSPEQEVTISSGTAIIEYLGEVDFFDSYATNCVNQYGTWGTVKPKVVRVELPNTNSSESSSFVVDSRFVGNEARFIRKSCIHAANCEIRPIYIPELKTFKFVVYTTKPIVLKGEVMEEELRLPWQWDVHHPIKKMIKQTASGEFEEGAKFDDFEDEEKVLLVSGVDKILNFVECACNTTSMNSICSIFKVKKATSYLLRSTRKASSLSNAGFNKSKEELVMPKKEREFFSWIQRLKERDESIYSAIFAGDLLHERSDDEEYGSDLNATSREGSVSVQKVIDEANVKTPYKRRMFAQGKRYASKKFKIESGTPESVNDAEVLLSVPKIIAVPLVDDILTTIKETVKNKLHLPGKLTNTASSTVKKEVTSANPVPSVLMQKDKVTDIKKVGEEVPVTGQPPKPPTVKKLSFADYKKKMK
ncbi:putative histone-binding protein [Clavispora lusitaniae]|uniref:Histone-binding protein n=1 Tax=Clavispora lusitaniae TaxID=36911 RepID=A0AA91Q217_CLALS|nr:putative histone-binding protein [Clavispora lusitaniae]